MRWFVAIAAAVLLAMPAHAAKIQARLIRASNESGNTDASLADICGKLKEKFGYKFYQQLGAQQQPLKPGEKLQLDLGQNFRVCITPKPAEKRQQELDLEWYSGKTLLVRSLVKVVENGHLLVKGPEVGNDWIVLAVSVRN
jgi:hypothetical protein